jgi:SAM-dependent methyltransferase
VAVGAVARDYISTMTLPARHAEMLDRIERGARYAWAKQIAAGRAVLDLGCGDGAGTAILSRAGSATAVGVDPSAQAVDRARREFGHLARFEVDEPMALSVPERSFDLIACFGALESSPLPEAVAEGIVRALRPGGVLLAALPAEASAEASPADAADVLRRVFEAVAFHEQRYQVGSAIGWPPEPDIAATEAIEIEPGRGGPQSVLVSAGDGALPRLEPLATFEEIAGLEALVDSVSQWEERARGAEAEVAAMRWELRIAGEKLTALVNRLHELENSPARRLGRVLRGKPVRYSVAEIADSARPGDATR